LLKNEVKKNAEPLTLHWQYGGDLRQLLFKRTTPLNDLTKQPPTFAAKRQRDG